MHPPFCCCGLLVRPNRGAVDHLHVSIVGSSDSVHQPVPDNRLWVHDLAEWTAGQQIRTVKRSDKLPSDAVALVAD